MEDILTSEELVLCIFFDVERVFDSIFFDTMMRKVRQWNFTWQTFEDTPNWVTHRFSKQQESPRRTCAEEKIALNLRDIPLI